MLILLLHIALTFTFIAIFTLFAVYAERKVSAYIQDRMGPMEVGPMGLFQTAADILKLILKESIIPDGAHKALFIFAPIVVFISIFAGYAAIPFTNQTTSPPLSVGIFYIIAIIALDVIGIWMAGWGSNNKYALLGAMRGIAQIVSYEIPTALTLVATVMMFGTLDLQEMAFLQGIYSPTPIRLWGIWDISEVGGFLSWSVVRYPHLIIAFLIYFIATLAECNRAPFDLPEAESELVAGFHVEYTGYRFAVLFLAEYGKMLLVSLIAVVLFFGGWNTLLPNLPHLPLGTWTSGEPGSWQGILWGCGWMLAKSFLLVFLQIWVRWVYPRLRPDQLMSFCWKYLTPFAIALIFISGILKLWESGGL